VACRSLLLQTGGRNRCIGPQARPHPRVGGRDPRHAWDCQAVGQRPVSGQWITSVGGTRSCLQQTVSIFETLGVLLVVLAGGRRRSSDWRRATAMQRKEPVASTRFLAVQFQELCGRSAAVRVGRQPTHSCLLTTQMACPEAVVGGAGPMGSRRRSSFEVIAT
jgi:hypothetical protein